MIKQIFWRGEVFLRLTLPIVENQLMPQCCVGVYYNQAFKHVVLTIEPQV